MVDPTPPDAAERALTDALTAPATSAELAREAEYVQAFTARHASLQQSSPQQAALREEVFASPVTRPVPARRRRLRIALAGGLAAVAITGTAAALSTTLPHDD